MSRTDRFTLDLRTVTPAFVRGRDAAAAELRAPSFKGQLRWWYRAWRPEALLEPGGPWGENRVMGGSRAGEGQCPFTLRIDPEQFDAVTWSKWTEGGRRAQPGEADGVRYLGFSLVKGDAKKDMPRAVPEGLSFQAVHTFTRQRAVTDELARGLIASWWLLVHLGGVGARSRRGFGSLSLKGWSWPGQEQLLSELPLPCEAASGEGWLQNMMRGLQMISTWRGDQARWPGRWPHPRLNTESTVVLETDSSWRDSRQALHIAGTRLKEGRRQYRGAMQVDGRVTFGLPLDSGPGRRHQWRPASFNRTRFDSGRNASALHLCVAGFERQYGLVWTRVGGPVAGRDGFRVRDEKSGTPFHEDAPAALDDFMTGLAGTRFTFGGAE